MNQYEATKQIDGKTVTVEAKNMFVSAARR